MTGTASQLRWQPPEGPGDRGSLWTRVIHEVIEDYPEADVIVTKEASGPFWTVLAVVGLPETRPLPELTHAIVAALKRVGLPASPAV